MYFTLLPSSPEAHYACRVMLASEEDVMVSTVSGNLTQFTAADVAIYIIQRSYSVLRYILYSVVIASTALRDSAVCLS